MRLTILLLPSAVLIPAQAPPAGDEIKKLGRLEGKVFNSVIGQPVASVAITLSPHFTTNGVNQFNASTDIEGHFSIEGVTPGLYNLSAAKEGFVRQVWGSRGKTLLGASITVEAGSHVTDLSFNLVPLGVLNGRVTDENGKPMRGVTIQALRHGYRMPNGAIVGGRQLLPVGVATTNESGEYRVKDLPPNTYFLRANRPLTQGAASVPTDPNKPDEGYASMYYPNSRDAAGAVGVRIESGVDLPGIDLRFHKILLYRIRGRLVDDRTGDPLGKHTLVFAPEEFGPGGPPKTTNEQGVFEITGVAPGTYLLVAGKAKPEDLTASQSIVVTERNVDGIVMRVPRPIEVSGTLRIADPAPGSSAPRGLSLGGVRITLATLDELSSSDAEIAEDGTFRVRNLAAGAYRVYVRGTPPNTYVKSITADRQESLQNEVNLVGGSELSIALSPSAAQFDCVVQDAKGKPMTGATFH